MHLAVGTGTVTAIPKAGSASIRRALFGQLYEIPERESPEGHWVAFVRHPLARLVSCYQHWIVNAFHHRMAVHGLTQGSNTAKRGARQGAARRRRGIGEADAAPLH
ncbi:MAG: sulfotransferase family protein, partial [Delftia sp.]|nr:sulfotransferase family protein [Delftia sp.]